MRRMTRAPRCCCSRTGPSSGPLMSTMPPFGRWAADAIHTGRANSTFPPPTAATRMRTVGDTLLSFRDRLCAAQLRSWSAHRNSHFNPTPVAGSHRLLSRRRGIDDAQSACTRVRGAPPDRSTARLYRARDARSNLSSRQPARGFGGLKKPLLERTIPAMPHILLRNPSGTVRLYTKLAGRGQITVPCETHTVRPRSTSRGASVSFPLKPQGFFRRCAQNSGAMFGSATALHRRIAFGASARGCWRTVVDVVCVGYSQAQSARLISYFQKSSGRKGPTFGTVRKFHRAES